MDADLMYFARQIERYGSVSMGEISAATEPEIHFEDCPFPINFHQTPWFFPMKEIKQ